MSASSIIHVVARSADSTGDTIGRDASFDDAIASLAKKTGQASLRTGADCGLQPHTNYQLTSSRGGRHTSPVPNHHGDIKSTAELGCLHKTLDLGAPQNCTAFPLLITREIRGFHSPPTQKSLSWLRSTGAMAFPSSATCLSIRPYRFNRSRAIVFVRQVNARG